MCHINHHSYNDFKCAHCVHISAFFKYVHTLCCAEWPTETDEDKLRSILAHLEYSHQVLEYDKAGVPFRTYMYVPEIHPVT